LSNSTALSAVTVGVKPTAKSKMAKPNETRIRFAIVLSTELPIITLVYTLASRDP